MQFGSYVIIAEIGSGGAGVVYRARDAQGRDVAIKVIKKAGLGECNRFEREQRLLGALGESEGFVPLLDAGDAPRPHLVMPFLLGGTLRDRLRGGPMPASEVVALGVTLGRTLGRAHAKGIVHRDVKPENVLFSKAGSLVTDSGSALVSDLGLAKHFSLEDDSARQSVSLSRSHELRGTVGYMPHEQVTNARDVGPQADVFALGALLYECLGGEPVFSGATVIDLLARVEAGRFTRLDRVRPDAPLWLVAAIHRALSFKPGERYADGAAFARALEAGGAVGVPVARIAKTLALLVAVAGVVAFAALTFAARPRSAEALAASAIDKLRAGDRDGAAALSSAAIEHDPHIALAWRVRALLLEDAKDPAAALAAASRAVALDPLDACSWRIQAEAREALADPRASDDAERVLELDAWSAAAWRIRAGGLRARGEIDAALVAATRAIALDPSAAKSWSLRGALRLARHDANGFRDTEGVFADAEQALALDADDALALAARGGARLEKKDLAGARADLDRAVARAPLLALGWAGLAVVRLRSGDRDGAVEAARRAMALEPASRDARPLAVLARVHLDGGELELAIDAATRALARDPSSTDALLARAHAKTSLTPPRYADALTDLDVAIRLGADSFDAWAIRGWVNERLNKNLDAVRDCTKAIEIDPRVSASWSNRGSAQYKLKAYDAAIADLTKALELDDKNPSGWCMRALAREQKRQFAQAAADMDRVLEINSDRVDWLKLRARMRKKAGDEEGAAKDDARIAELEKKR